MDGLCIVCGKILGQYETIDEHLYEGSFDIDSWHGMNAVHELHERKVLASAFKEPCFCGGKIVTVPNGKSGFRIVCEKCEYEWASI